MRARVRKISSVCAPATPMGMTKYQEFTSDSGADIFPQINGKEIQSNVDNVKQTSYKDSRVYYRLTFSSCSFLIITEELRGIRR